MENSLVCLLKYMIWFVLVGIVFNDIHRSFLSVNEIFHLHIIYLSFRKVLWLWDGLVFGTLVLYVIYVDFCYIFFNSKLNIRKDLLRTIFFKTIIRKMPLKIIKIWIYSIFDICERLVLIEHFLESLYIALNNERRQNQISIHNLHVI